MGFWQRLKNLFSANINAALDAAEDPDMALEQLVRDMNAELRKTKSYLAEAIVNMKKLERDAEKHRKLAQDYREKAKIILTDDDPDNDYLAKEALLRQKENEQISAQYMDAFEKQKSSVEALKRNIDKMERKVHEAKAKKSMLVAKKQITETQAKVLGASAAGADNSVFQQFQQIEEKIEDYATRTEVEAEIARESNIDDQLEEIEFGNDVDAEMEALKKELLIEAKETPKQIDSGN